MGIVTTLEEIVRKASLALVPLLPGCIAVHYPLDQHYKGPKEISKFGQTYYSYSKGPPKLELDSILEDNEYYTLRHLVFDNKDSSYGLACVDYYDVKREGKNPLIIISPVLIGSDIASESFARYFARNGVAVALIDKIDDGLWNLVQQEGFAVLMEDGLKKSVVNIRRVLDYFEQQEDIDNSRIGSFGISMGGIKNCVAASIDSRLKVNVFCLTGEDLPYLFLNSDIGMIEIPRRKLLKRYSEHPELYLTLELGLNLVSDPKHFASSLDARNTMMIIASYDRGLPTSQQFALRERIGNPETIIIPAGHYTSFFWMRSIRDDVLEFFNRRFAKLDR